MDGSNGTARPAPEVSGGVHTLTVTGATPGTRLRVVDSSGRDVVTLVADAVGNAHLAFVPRAPHRAGPSGGDRRGTGHRRHARCGRVPRVRPQHGSGSGPGCRGRARGAGHSGPLAVRPGAGRGLRLPHDARRRAAVGHGPLPEPGPVRARALPDRDRVLGVLAVGPRRATAVDAAREPDGLRGGRREHAWQRLLGRRVRRVQPGTGCGRLRRRGDGARANRGSCTVGRAWSG